MKPLIRLILSIFTYFFICQLAGATTVFTNQIEEQISKQVNLKHVVISQNLKLECTSCRINDLKIDTSKQSFSIEIFDEKEVKQINGNYYEAIKLPVVIRKISKNDLISEEKIEYKKLRNNRTYDDYILDKSEIIGKVATKNLTIGLPVNKRDVSKGELIKRNSEVKIIYNKGAISLESVGKALTEGQIGSVIKVKNLESGKIISGLVINSKTVSIGE